MPEQDPRDLLVTPNHAQDDANVRALLESEVHRTPDRIERIPAGLGQRRFYRVHFSSGTPLSLIARIEDEAAAPTGPLTAPTEPATGIAEAPAWLPEPGLEPIRSFLEEAGLPVPRCYASNLNQGIDLLEDVGNRTLADAPEQSRSALYQSACALIPRMQSLQADANKIPAFARRFDRDLVATKAWKWLHWTIPLLLGREPTPDEIEGHTRLFDRIADTALAAPLRLSHRDFKAENLHLRASDRDVSSDARDGLVMIDIQGAFLAPPEYDLVCLLYDMQAGLDEKFIDTCFRETLPHLPDRPSEAEARIRFDALAVARLCKDLSHVVHAGCVRNDRRRWHELPRGLTLLGAAAGRLSLIWPEVRPLNSVIQALTPAVRSADSGARG